MLNPLFTLILKHLYKFLLIILFCFFFLSNNLIIKDELIINCLFIFTFIIITQTIANSVTISLKIQQIEVIYNMKNLIKKFFLLNFSYYKINNFFFIFINKIFQQYLFYKIFKNILINNLRIKCNFLKINTKSLIYSNYYNIFLILLISKKLT